MAHKKTSKRSKTRTMLRLDDLEQSKNAVLYSLGAASSQESYSHAIDEFIGWYCSEPRLVRRLRNRLGRHGRHRPGDWFGGRPRRERVPS
jgi:hypothetical protein